MRSASDADAKLDSLIGKVDALMAMQNEHASRLDGLAERTVTLEQGVAATRELVEAWITAKTGLRFLKWAAGLIAAIGAVSAAMKGWLHR